MLSRSSTAIHRNLFSSSRSIPTAPASIGKTNVPEEEITNLWKSAEVSGLFKPAGHELKCMIDRPFTDVEISALLSWCDEMAATIRRYGLKE
jgi:hypothetical protein